MPRLQGCRLYPSAALITGDRIPSFLSARPLGRASYRVSSGFWQAPMNKSSFKQHFENKCAISRARLPCSAAGLVQHGVPGRSGMRGLAGQKRRPGRTATVLDLVHHSNVRFAYYKPGVCRHPKVTPVPDFDTM